MRTIDADALINAFLVVRKAVNEKPDTGMNVIDAASHALPTLLDGLIKTINSLPTIEGSNMSSWVSVKDRLPERKWIDCLVATRIQTDGTRGINIAWLNDDNGVWKSNDEWICDGREIVTHWMPPPELPKEDGNG